MKRGLSSVLWLLTIVGASAEEPAKQLLLYLVEESSSPGSRLVDTPEFPRLGYIAKEPAMRITALKSVAFKSWPADTKASPPVVAGSDVTIELAEKDVKAFGKLTMTGAMALKRIAIFLDDKLLAAVKVVDPIYEGKISMTSLNEESLRAIEKQLKVLVRE